MLGVTVFGVFFTPVFYYVIRWLTRGKTPATSPTPQATTVTPQPTIKPPHTTPAKPAATAGAHASTP
jgi:hypothetical protein